MRRRDPRTFMSRMMGIMGVMGWLSMSVVMISCEPIDGTPEPEPGEEGIKGTVYTTDMFALAEEFLNRTDVRQSIGTIGAAMGYGWYWGCPDSFPGWGRTALTPLDGSWKEVRFAPQNPGQCPGDQPGLKTALWFNVMPSGQLEISGIRTLATRGVPTPVTKALTCPPGAGVCHIKQTVSTGYTVSKTKTHEVSFGQELGMELGVEFNAGLFDLIGNKTTLKISFKTSWGMKEGSATTDAKTQTESAEYFCPLGEKIKGHTYKGMILSVPARVAADFATQARLVPHLMFEGFPRRSDGGGNHWTDHTRDRPIRQQRYGHDDVPFWQELRYYYDTGYEKKDENTDARLSWADLKGNSEHAGYADGNIAWLASWEGYFTRALAGSSITDVDDLYCVWTDVTNPKKPAETTTRPRLTAAKGTDEASAGSDLVSKGQTVSAAVKRAIRSYLKKHPELLR